LAQTTIISKIICILTDAFHSKEADMMDTTTCNCIHCTFATEYLVETTKHGLK